MFNFLTGSVCTCCGAGEANEGGSDQEAAEGQEERSAGGGEPRGSRAAQEAQRVHRQVHIPRPSTPLPTHPGPAL